MVPSLPNVTPTKLPSSFVTRMKMLDPLLSNPTSALVRLVPNTPIRDTECYLVLT